MVCNLSIKDLENYSGIKAHTIRIWEKRYNLFDPDRSTTNIRSYTNSDLKKLLNIVILLGQGKRISQISRLNEEEIYEYIEAIHLNGSDNSYELVINELLVATLDCNIQKFEKAFSGCVLKSGLEQTVEKAVYPMLKRIGLLWSIDKINPSQEHFASQIIRQKLFVAIDGVSTVLKLDAKRFVLYLPDGENHDIGLLYANYLIRKSGHEVIYLGSDVPLENLKFCVEVCGASQVLTLFTINRSKEVFENYIQKLRKHFNKQKILIAGVIPENIIPEHNPGVVHLKGIEDLRVQL